MGFFIDKQNRRKSPVALAAFGAGIADLLVFGILYALLAEPLYNLLAFESATWTNLAHSAVIALIGTGVCCLWFLLSDKRIAPYGFACLALLLVLFFLSTVMLNDEARNVMLYVLAMYGIAPVLIGNAVTWAIYTAWKRSHPAARRKTLREELQEGIDRQAKRKSKSVSSHPSEPEPEKPAAPRPSVPQTSDASEPDPYGDPNSFAEPDPSESPRPNRPSVQDEAMLLYGDDDDPEA